jgi:nucleotide-binding universal stress UspA family protein
MYTRMLIPLDGSKTAENVLPYARALAGKLKIPVELIGVIDIGEMATHISAEKAHHLDTMIEDGVRRSEAYINEIAKTFPAGNVKCTVEKGRPEEVIIEKGAADSGILIAMATHGRSGINRWLLLLGASIWIGGHLVLVTTILPRALRNRERVRTDWFTLTPASGYHRLHACLPLAPRHQRLVSVEF